ncbi:MULTISPECIES: phosphoadenosine phosphosulfate reductase domain-containing protein [unclassified Roseburia]|uniref:phosphoadenosine phosphosulfate reductase domain-containing protein n=1 Tax=unclassified Roseburia TaxID=2637578 RepID=UPI001FA91EF8|nr:MULTISPECIES: phosphoadenosine phosphosulfate reductase family protein [unclassified Roseburia]
MLLEILLKKPFAFLKDSVWNGSGNKYYVNGKRIDFSVKDLIEVDAEEVRKQYEDLREQNTYQYFDSYIKRFLEENRERYEEITTEATGYIRESTKNYKIQDMFVSFSGGKDSTVVSSLVMRALSEPKILHIFGDTTLEFPETMHYVERFKKEHPKTPVLSSRNKEKNFEELCELMGPPSRVMRWCCTIFKTGAIQRKIKALFGDKDKIITFYGIRRSESASRSKYERETEGSKITKQITISPIIDWMDFDIWLYLLTTKTDFNDAYRWGYTRVAAGAARITVPGQNFYQEFICRSSQSTGRNYWLILQGGLASRMQKVISGMANGKPDRAEMAWNMPIKQWCHLNPVYWKKTALIMNCSGRFQKNYMSYSGRLDISIRILEMSVWEKCLLPQKMAIQE